MGGFNLGDTSVTTSLKYGLNASAKRKPAKAPARPLAAFADADDDDDGPSDAAGAHRRGNAEVARQQAAARDDARARAIHAAALQQDASVFEYDAHHDAHSDARRAKQREADEERVDRKSRYVETLMKRRDEREREDAVLKERRLVREREREDHLYGDKEKFVTAAYKKKLEKDEQWLAEEKARDDAEARDTAKARESGFGFDAIRRSALESAGGPRAGQKEDANAGTAELTEPSEPTEQEKRKKGNAKGDETTTRADEELVAPRRSSADAAKSSPRASVEARDSPPVLAAEPAAVARDSAPVANRADSAKARDARARYLERKRRRAPPGS
jgi:coiled-coil domain-containing protein 55